MNLPYSQVMNYADENFPVNARVVVGPAIILIAAVVLALAWPSLAIAQAGPPESSNSATVAQIQSLLIDKVGFLVLGAVFLALGIIVVLLTAARSEARDGVLRASQGHLQNRKTYECAFSMRVIEKEYCGDDCG